MELTNEQEKELQERGYRPHIRNVSLYREDFKKDQDWKEVCKALDLRGDAYAYRRITIGVCGTKFKYDWED